MTRKIERTWRGMVADRLSALDMESKADRFMDCGNVRAVVACEADHTHYAAISVSSCQLPFCPDCARVIAADLAARYTERARKVIKANKHRGYRMKLITLTRSFDMWDSDVIHKINEAWIDLTCLFDVLLGDGSPHWSERGHKKCTGEGIIPKWEFGEKGNKFHFHVIFFGRYIEQKKLSELWAYFNRVNDTIVDIRARGSTEKIIKEGIKYLAKFTKSYAVSNGEQIELLPDPDFIARLAYICQGMRSIRARGCFYGIEDEQSGVIEDLCPECGGLLTAISPSVWQAEHGQGELCLLNLIRVDKFANIGAIYHGSGHDPP